MLLNYFAEAIEEVQGYVIPPTRSQQHEGIKRVYHNVTTSIIYLICRCVPLRRLEYRDSTPEVGYRTYRACKWVTIHGVTPRDWSLLGTKRD